MVVSENHEVIDGRRRLIYTDVLDSEESAQDGSIDDYASDLDEEGESGLVEEGVITCVTELVTKYMEVVQQAVNFSSLSSYMFKPLS